MVGYFSEYSRPEVGGAGGNTTDHWYGWEKLVKIKTKVAFTTFPGGDTTFTAYKLA
jgi:hypothetical protein